MRLNKIFTKSSEILFFLHRTQACRDGTAVVILLLDRSGGLQKMSLMLWKQMQDMEIEMSICFLLNTW